MIPRNIAQHHRSLGVQSRVPYPNTETPKLLQRAGARFFPGVYNYAFKHELSAPKISSNLRLSECGHRNAWWINSDISDRMMRVANIFSFVNPGTEELVELTHDDNNRRYTGLEMIAFIAPLNIGQRRGCRLLSGYTPLYKARSDHRVWGQMGEYARVRVQWPLMRSTNEILGHQ